MTNVKVYVSLRKAGAGERMEMEMERGRWREEEEEKNKGGSEEMPCIPLSGQRKPQREGRGGEETTEMREKYRKRRRRGKGGGGGQGLDHH